VTQYEKAKEIFPDGMVTALKPIEHYCPSDLIHPSKDMCNSTGNESREKCKECWNQIAP
jgi:hypothetical protein